MHESCATNICRQNHAHLKRELLYHVLSSRLAHGRSCRWIIENKFHGRSKGSRVAARVRYK